jgi:hypothetical protein
LLQIAKYGKYDILRHGKNDIYRRGSLYVKYAICINCRDIMPTVLAHIAPSHENHSLKKA